MMDLHPYAKAVAAAVGAALIAAQAVITDGITAQEWLTIAIAAGGAAGVWAVPNRTDLR